MIRRFSNNSWGRRKASMHSPELRAWIAQVLRDAARRPDGVAERSTQDARCKTPTGRVFRETDNEAECRTLDGHGTIFVPKCYEEKYPYPLIVWLNASEYRQPMFDDFLSGLSDRNYLGFAPDKAATADIIDQTRHESPQGLPVPAASLTRLHDAVKAIRREVHIHTERVIVAGIGEGATAALSLFLGRPEWFGGAVILDGRLSKDSTSLHSIEELRDKRVFLANSTAGGDASNPLSEMVATGRLLNSAGLSVTTRACDSPDPLDPVRLADVNEWVMDGVCATV